MGKKSMVIFGNPRGVNNPVEAPALRPTDPEYWIGTDAGGPDRGIDLHRMTAAEVRARQYAFESSTWNAPSGSREHMQQLASRGWVDGCPCASCEANRRERGGPWRGNGREDRYRYDSACGCPRCREVEREGRASEPYTRKLERLEQAAQDCGYELHLHAMTGEPSLVKKVDKKPFKYSGVHPLDAGITYEPPTNETPEP